MIKQRFAFGGSTVGRALAAAVFAATAIPSAVLAAPDCRDTCQSKAKDLYDECILLGGSPLDCQRESNEFLLACFARCPPATVAFPLVMCVEMETESQSSIGNGFPWENSLFFFSEYRNQYLFPSNTLADLAASGVTTIDSIHARAVSFSAPSTNVYGAFRPPYPPWESSIRIYDTTVADLSEDYNDNIDGPLLGALESAPGAPIVIETIRGPHGSMLSTCSSCADGDAWFEPIELANVQNLLIDHLMSVETTGQSGGSIWDTTTQQFGEGCMGPQRAFSSGTFESPHLYSTALGIDDNAFVWVFAGRAPGKGHRLGELLEQSVERLLRPSAQFLTPTGDGPRRDGAVTLADPGGKSEDDGRTRRGTAEVR